MMKEYTHYNDIPIHVTELARKNRINPTPHEEKLWSIISGKKMNGLKFRRQFPIGRYIVDFYNHAHRLIIEVDGGIHKIKEEYDGNRTAFLVAGGYTVIRFTNEEIENDILSVIEKLRNCATSPPAGD